MSVFFLGNVTYLTTQHRHITAKQQNNNIFPPPESEYFANEFKAVRFSCGMCPDVTTHTDHLYCAKPLPFYVSTPLIEDNKI